MAFSEKKFVKNAAKQILKSTLKSPYIRSVTPLPLRIFDSPHRRREMVLEKMFYQNTDPGIGALVYCELFPAEHSGIYLGKGQIAQLSGNGRIEIVTPERFTDNLVTMDRDIFIPVNKEGVPISFPIAVFHARKQVGSVRNYHVLQDNCHQFSAGCITGIFENDNNYLVRTKKIFEIKVGQAVKWRRWKWYQ